MTLAYKEYGRKGLPPLLILHGLFGMLDNWHLHARMFADHFHVFTIDQRNHGHSPHSDDMNYPLMADDIAAFCEDKQLHDILLLGHSMGGKTAMQTAVSHPSLLQKLMIADIAPKRYQAGHTLYIQALKDIPFHTLTSRKDADDLFSAYEKNPGIRLFLLKNLEKADIGYRLKCNLHAIEKHYDDIIGEVDIPYPLMIPTLFLKGEHSSYITPDDEANILEVFPEAQFAQIQGAGHWLHADNPSAFFHACMAFLKP
jgi:esterase